MGPGLGFLGFNIFFPGPGNPPAVSEIFWAESLYVPIWETNDSLRALGHCSASHALHRTVVLSLETWLQRFRRLPSHNFWYLVQ